MKLLASISTVILLTASTVSFSAPRLRQHPERYTLVDLGTLGGSQSHVRGIGDAGQVVGDSETNSKYFCGHAFLWQNGSMTDLTPSDPNRVSYAFNVDDAGNVAGCWSDPVTSYPCGFHPFVWNNGARKDLDCTGQKIEPHMAVNDYAVCVTKAGVVIGDVNGVAGTTYPCYWTNGVITVFTNLGNSMLDTVGANSRGDILVSGPVGKIRRPAQRSYLIMQHKTIMLGTLGGNDCWAKSINGADEIVGISSQRGGRNVAFEWRLGKGMRALQSPRGYISGASSVDDNGDVAGWIKRGKHGPMLACVWIRGRCELLAREVTNPDGWALNEAVAINDRHQVACNASKKQVTHAVLLNPDRI